MNHFEDILDDGAGYIVKLQDKKREVEDEIINFWLEKSKIETKSDELKKHKCLN